MNVLHNLVSLLQRKRRGRRSKKCSTRRQQSCSSMFFNNQTTDKCGRLMANAAEDFGFLVLLQKYQVLAQ
ncbi:hypothetical protein GA566_24985 [Cupriavidus sp. SW-Y-13]|nr:hypothetical protein [Cupriavidus sp. SW-Y-13]